MNRSTDDTSSTDGSSEVHDPDRLKKLPSCTACKRSKVRCDRNVPCTRCQRLQIECIPQQRLPGRPITLNKPLPPAAMQRFMLELAPSGAYTASSGALSSGQAHIPTPLPTPPLVARQGPSFAAGAPGYNAGAFVARFASLVGAQRVVQERTQAILMSWHISNTLLGKDLTCGALSTIAAFVGIDLPQQLPPQPTLAHVAGRRDKGMDGGSSSGSQPTCSEEAQLEIFLQSCEALDGSAACTVVSRAGKLEVSANERFSSSYLDPARLKHVMHEGGMRPEYVWERNCIAHDSRKAFVEGLCDAWFTMAQQDSAVESCRVIKVRDRYAHESIALVRVRIFVSPGGWYSASCLYLLPLPVSQQLVATVPEM